MELSIPQIALMSRLLDEALPLDAVGRRLWLARLSPEYQDLAPALRSALLPETSQPADSNGLVMQPKLDSADESAVRAANLLQPGARVGPYELIRPLGAGGMAQVWLARRADGAFKRKVALKVPTLRHLRADLEQRFARERDILASLEHPQIARFYDAGIDLNGLPYFAMEYVQGDLLPAWCDAQRLGVRERLKLVLQVLDALQYAHAHHVLHRDIKPSNILVNEAGQVRLLDFGVAKLLAQEEHEPGLTVVYGRALTPEYASPELARGDSVDPASDMYSLGVVLYELLTGSLPYGIVARGSATLLEQSIITAEVARPSTHLAPEAGAARAVTQGKLARQLRGDLDAVALKALAKTPSDRYASAAAFADDLQRYLRGQPVKARPDHLTYRFGKLVRRRPADWAAVAAAVTAAAALTFALIRTPRSVPVTATIAPFSIPVVAVPPQQETSIAVLPFADMSEKKDQEYFSDGLSEELISHLAHSPDLKVIARTSSFQFKGKNEDARSIASKLGVAHLLEGSVRKADHALRISVQLVRASDGAQLWSQTYDRSLVDIFKVQDEIAGKVAQAMHVTLANSDQTRSRQPDVEAYNLVLEGNYLKARWTQRDLERAIQLYRNALDIRPDYALAWARLAGAYFDQQALTGTASAADNRRILDALDRAIRLDPKLALAYFTRAGFELTVSWDWKAAAASVERVREIEPGSDLLPRALGGLALTFGQVDRAVELYEKALERDPLDARSLAYLGDALCAANRTRECLQARLRLLQLHPEFGGVYSALGATQLQVGQFAEALDSIQKEPEERYRLVGLAMVYSALGRRADSDAALQSLEGKFALTDAYAIAEAHAYRAEVDAAFKWLDRAYRQRDTEMSSVKTDPLLRNLHDDKRFRELLVKLRLAPEKPFSTDEGRS